MHKLYIHTEDVHNMIAPREVVPIIMDLIQADSVLDVGCGIGTWLRAFEESGVSDYLGVDGDYIDKSQLSIPVDRFIAKDLRTPWSLNRKFDLVLSLEVAEHLPETCADLFVETLVSHSNGAIIFSAAIPKQGGQNHLNEQWPSYWKKKFQQYGYEFYDCIRPQVWDNPNVEVWYKQNIFIVTNDKSLIKLQCGYLDVVHPETYNARVNDYNHILQGKAGLYYSFLILWRALKFFLRNRNKE